MRIRISNTTAAPTAFLVLLLILDIAQPGYRKYLLVPEFKNEFSKQWGRVRPTLQQTIPALKPSPTPAKKQPTTPVRQWIAPTPVPQPPGK
jgi:hypothetical protein